MKVAVSRKIKRKSSFFFLLLLKEAIIYLSFFKLMIIKVKRKIKRIVVWLDFNRSVLF